MTTYSVDAPGEAARPLDVPGEVERVLDLLDHHDHGVDQDHEADRAEHRRLRVLDELHDPDREFRAFLAERAQELVQHGLELAVVAESLAAPRTRRRRPAPARTATNTRGPWRAGRGRRRTGRAAARRRSAAGSRPAGSRGCPSASGSRTASARSGAAACGTGDGGGQVESSDGRAAKALHGSPRQASADRFSGTMPVFRTIHARNRPARGHRSLTTRRSAKHVIRPASSA